MNKATAILLICFIVGILVLATWQFFWDFEAAFPADSSLSLS